MTDTNSPDAKLENRPITCVTCWWCPEHKCWIASAQTIEGLIGLGPTFLEAAEALDRNLREYHAEQDLQKC